MIISRAPLFSTYFLARFFYLKIILRGAAVSDPKKLSRSSTYE